MSEYQSYAFQAIDRRLTDKEMAELRSVSALGVLSAIVELNSKIQVSGTGQKKQLRPPPPAICPAPTSAIFFRAM
jgi:hypothetical protein